MRSLSLRSSLLAGLATLATQSFAATCIIQKHGTWTYLIEGPEFPGMSGICGGLWDNLAGWPLCSASSTFCGAVGFDNHFKWTFTVPNTCNAGMVHSAWYEATKNLYYSINCG